MVNIVMFTLSLLLKLAPFYVSIRQYNLSNFFRLCLYKIIRELRDVPSDIIQKFFQDILSDLLSAKPCSLKMEDAFACQDKWTFEFLSETTKAKYEQVLCTCQYKSLPPPTPGTSGALAGDSRHFVSILVNQVISKTNESYSPLCPGSGSAGIYIDWCIIVGFNSIY